MRLPSDLSMLMRVVPLTVVVFVLLAVAISAWQRHDQSIPVTGDIQLRTVTGEPENPDTYVEEFLAHATPGDWETVEQGAGHLSMGWVDHPHLFRVPVDATKLPSEPLLFEIGFPLLDTVHLYTLDDTGNIVDRFVTGDRLEFSQRPIHDTQFVFPINVAEDNLSEIIIYVKTTSSLQLPIRFWRMTDYYASRANFLAAQGIFFGIFLVMIFYNLFLYISIKHTAYFHYVCFVTCFLVIHMGMKGLGFQFLWPNAPSLSDYAIATGGASCLLFLLLFARNFLRLEQCQRCYRVNNVLITVAVVLIAGSFIIPYRNIIQPVALMVIVGALSVIVAAVIRYRSGLVEARFYLLGCLSIVIGSLIYLIKQFGFLPVTFTTEYALQIGSAVEVVLLSLALADRINSLDNELESVNDQLIDQNQVLEREVKHRTSELMETLEHLANANSELSEISTTDKLTGVKNRHYFDEVLKKELSRVQRHKSRLSLIICDIDYFKRVNDKWGHVVGDNALKSMSAALQKTIRRGVDDVCRFGGEEFTQTMQKIVLIFTFDIVQNGA